MAETLLHVARGHVKLGSPVKPKWLGERCRELFAEIVHALRNGGPDQLRLELSQDKERAECWGGRSHLPVALIEYVLEEVRQQEFPERPSRLECVFLCTSLDDAKHYRLEFLDGRGLIYECSVEDRTPFCGDMALINGITIDVNDDLVPQIERMKETARRYWAGGDADGFHWPEVLAAGRVVALRKVAS